MKEDLKVIELFKNVVKSVSNYKNVIDAEDYENAILHYIIEISAKHYYVAKSFIFRPTRKREIVEARRMCIALMKEHLPFSDGAIGQFLGGRSKQYVNKSLNTSPLNQNKLTNKDEIKFVEDFLILTKDVYVFKKTFNMENKNDVNE